ncbi:MAG: PhzF family phenazine biosynthesis protein [Planctomycetes bacterium]|nr:PhzF family phenazine biosynthesis protein [Planctomycetota bacterium]
MTLELPIARIAAFVGDSTQSGNTASVVRLQKMLPDGALQALARRNGDSETAYLLDRGDGRWQLRWFTPGVEVDLCGHATLAAGHHLLEQSLASGPIVFETLSGELTVDVHDDERLVLDLPIDTPQESEAPQGTFPALGIDEADVLSVHLSRDLIITVRESRTVSELAPDHRFLQALPMRGIVITAGGDGEVDFVSRWFGGDGVGVVEDPVTGSAHAALAPLWGQRLDKSRLEAQQWSPEGGVLTCIVGDQRVTLLGRCQSWLSGMVQVDLL